jgi:hypothetical protein
MTMIFAPCDMTPRPDDGHEGQPAVHVWLCQRGHAGQTNACTACVGTGLGWCPSCEHDEPILLVPAEAWPVIATAIAAALGQDTEIPMRDLRTMNIRASRTAPQIIAAHMPVGGPTFELIFEKNQTVSLATIAQRLLASRETT